MYREQVSWWRRRARRPVTLVARVPERPAQDQVVMVEARLALRDALLALPPGKRAVLVLRYLEDLPEAQVADILGCSVGTVRSQTHKAIVQLRLVLPSLGLTRPSRATAAATSTPWTRPRCRTFRSKARPPSCPRPAASGQSG
jgi:DNA-directed RNA polymerase specialized sigma24 family protein